MLNSLSRWARKLSRNSKRLLQPNAHHHEDCRFLDARQSGWFNGKTGELLPGFQISAKDTVIDVGCGDGAACMFAGRSGAEVIATDIDPEVVAKVETKLQQSKARAVRAIVSDSNPLPIESGTGSKVICAEVLEHVDDPTAVMNELVRIGKPGARYMIAVPDPVSESLQRVLAPPIHWRKPNHLRVFERNEFELLLQNAGLIVERRIHYGFYWSIWWSLFWASDQSFTDPEGPILENWTKTWHALITSPRGAQVKQALDEFMPKSQALIARKA